MVKESGNSLWGLKTTVETLIHNLSQTSLYAHRNEDTEKKKKKQPKNYRLFMIQIRKRTRIRFYPAEKFL